MTLGIILSMVPAILGALGLVVGLDARRRAVRSKRVEESMGEFLEIRLVVRDKQTELQRLAYLSAPQQWKLPGESKFSLLCQPGWILDKPIPISRVKLSFTEASQAGGWDAVRSESSKLLPFLPGGRTRATYSQALVDLDRRSELFNGYVYRLLSVRFDDQGPSLVFGPGRYFDYLDTGEVLAYEAARAWRAGDRGFKTLPIRRLLGDPFDFERRSTSCGIITLTIRNSRHGAGFYLHRRNPGEVASGVLHAVPAGEFAPSDITEGAIRTDLSLWKNIVREYAEEILGVPDAYGKGGRSVDFDQERPYSHFVEAAAKGGVRCYFLGLGLDPLTWKPEVLTVCIFDEKHFDRILLPALLGSAPVGEGAEGTTLMGRYGHGLPFQEDQVATYLRSDMRDAGRACLSLAWHHRRLLGLAVD